MNASANGKSLSAALWPVLALFLGWGVLITQLRHHWGGESYYNFGWFVPFLSIWLLYRNLQHLRPDPPHSWRGTVIVAVTATILLLPSHALSEVNPFWRVPLWTQALALSAFSLAVLHGIYGRAGIRAGLFPFFFLLTMIPWPYRIEVIIIQALTGVVVSIAMSGIHLLGYPVELAGNSFVLGELQIGVNEACSGIRSLQALFMVTLFLGSLFGQDRLRRVLAIVVLPLIVVAVNSARAIFLSLQVIVNGDEAYQAWHDPAGYIAFGISMVLIYACIELLNIGSAEQEAAETLPLNRFIEKLRAFPRQPALMLFPFLPLAVFLIVEGWFRFHEMQSREWNDWHMAIPSEANPDVRHAEIHPQIAGILGYSFGERFHYRLSQNTLVEVYYYGYDPDNKLASVSSYGHSPAICMEAVGASVVREFAPLIVNLGPFAIPLRHYLFRLNRTEQELHVFWVVWERRNQGISAEELASLDYRTQLVQLLRGRRDFSRKVVLASVSSATGTLREDRVRGEIKGLLSQWLVPEQTD
jgi:exosortase